MTYPVIYERSKTGFGAFSPNVPGCGVVADTLEETKSLFAEALEMHLRSMIADGDELPPTEYRSIEIGPDELFEVVQINVEQPAYR